MRNRDKVFNSEDCDISDKIDTKYSQLSSDMYYDSSSEDEYVVIVDGAADNLHERTLNPSTSDSNTHETLNVVKMTSV
ncbi:hypothetical protein SNE40_020826 [Patella caerulea]|uniref:Uncharacterized protein n=1 Tax=Patella caerulea TaxID=87958 RepID=A0AAN8J5Z2_PATCE